MIIDVKQMSKTYRSGEIEVLALRNIELDVEEGDFIAIMGPSGSGKSTLMHILGCLDRPTTGTYLLDGKDVTLMQEKELALTRSCKIGFVFQTFNLLPRMTALRNVEQPLLYQGIDGKMRHHLASQALDSVGLSDRLAHRPNELSGGQRQRVAIARALVSKPKIIFADEPTGNLDTVSGEEIMGIFQRLNDNGTTIVLVTHEYEIACHAKRIIHIRDGKISSDDQVAKRTIIGGGVPV